MKDNSYFSAQLRLARAQYANNRHAARGGRITLMHSASHITPEMMKGVLDNAFSTAITQSDKDAAKHLRNTLLQTHGTYASVLFDILEMAARHDRKGVAEIALLVGLQAGYELGIVHPPPAE